MGQAGRGGSEHCSAGGGGVGAAAPNTFLLFTRLSVKLASSVHPFDVSSQEGEQLGGGEGLSRGWEGGGVSHVVWGHTTEQASVRAQPQQAGWTNTRAGACACACM